VKERRVGAAKSPHIGGGLVGVDVSFVSFLCAKEKRNEVCFFTQRNVCFFDKEMFVSLHKENTTTLLHFFLQPLIPRLIQKATAFLGICLICFPLDLVPIDLIGTLGNGHMRNQ